MKLLLDEMFPSAVARELRARGHDVIAVVEEPGLRGLPDDELLAAAQAAERAVVTENVPDYVRLDLAYRHEGRSHHGILLTSERRFPRRDPGTIGHLVSSLDTLATAQRDLRDRLEWLE